MLLALLGLAGLVALVQAKSEAIAHGHNVTICHATGSATNPYGEISVSTKGADGGTLSDHVSHEDDIIPAPSGGCPSEIPPGRGDPGSQEHKLDVCHVTGSATNPVVLVNIARSDLQHHLDHGDYLPNATTGCAPAPTTPRDPGDPLGPNTPPAAVVVTQAPVEGTAESTRTPARVCTSRRSFRIRVRTRKRDPVVRATVKVNGKRVRTLKGKRLTAPVVLRGLPKGQFLVRITATTRRGRKLTGARRYRTCAPKSKRQTIPLL